LCRLLGGRRAELFSVEFQRHPRAGAEVVAEARLTIPVGTSKTSSHAVFSALVKMKREELK
jgi:hypothetical protein